MTHTIGVIMVRVSCRASSLPSNFSLFSKHLNHVGHNYLILNTVGLLIVVLQQQCIT